MAVTITHSTLPEGKTPICSGCGIATEFDLHASEYEDAKEFWDNWVCCDCDARSTLGRWKAAAKVLRP